jgi:hypothetical protein
MSALLDVIDRPGPSDPEHPEGAWEQAMASGVRSWMDAGPEGRQAVRAAIDQDRSWALLSWAELTATLAVRRRDRGLLVLAASGLSLFNPSAIDARDAQVVLQVIARAAELVGTDRASVIREAADASDAEGGRWLLAVLPPPEVGLPSTHEEVGQGDTFAFRRIDTGGDPEADLADWIADDERRHGQR